MSIKVLELFSGIRATSEALTRLGINHETTTVEYDKKVQDVANTLWGTNDPVRDVTKFIPEQKYDLVVAGFPCQPFSMAGKGQGFDDEKGRGKLYQDTLRVIKAANPDYVILENVKAIMSDKHKWIITEIKNTLKEWGYFVHTQIINAKEYLPQNRERVFIIASKLRQPEQIKGNNHKKIVKDFLEENVKGMEITNNQRENLTIQIEKLFEKHTDKIIKIGNVSKSNHSGLNVYSDSGILATFRENHGASIKIAEVEEFMLENRVNIKELFYKFNAENYLTGAGTESERERDPHTLGTITATGANSKQKILESLKPLKIRTITPRESWRFMGWKDEQIDKIIHLPKSNIYYTAGNSMVIPVMEAIIKELILKKEVN